MGEGAAEPDLQFQVDELKEQVEALEAELSEWKKAVADAHGMIVGLLLNAGGQVIISPFSRMEIDMEITSHLEDWEITTERRFDGSLSYSVHNRKKVQITSAPSSSNRR